MCLCVLGRRGCIYVGLWDCKTGPADILGAGRGTGISDKSWFCGPESNIARTGQQAGDNRQALTLQSVARIPSPPTPQELHSGFALKA